MEENEGKCQHRYRHRDGKCSYDAMPDSKFCFWHVEKDEKNLERRDDLRDLNLFEAYLVKANLNFANLENANLAYANLQDASLWHTNLKEALLAHANLRGADIFNAKVRNTHNLASATLDYIEVNEKRGDSFCKKKVKDYEDYRSAIDAYGRAKAIHRNLKTYFRDAGLYNISSEHYVREQIIEGKRLRIANKIKKEEDFCWHFPYYEFKDTKSFHLFFFLETKSKWILNRFLDRTSRYGESPLRVILISIFIVFLYAIFYWLSSGIINVNMNETTNSVLSFWEYFYFSIVTFTTLGLGDFHPTGWVSQILAASEAFVGAFLLAYFVVVISRKIMR